MLYDQRLFQTKVQPIYEVGLLQISSEISFLFQLSFQQAATSVEAI